uniref:Uncharacterized protein n=1 Tax=Micrurus corallinus TaxID=54390 RepID=A0A2D4GCE0_MICCO
MALVLTRSFHHLMWAEWYLVISLMYRPFQHLQQFSQVTKASPHQVEKEQSYLCSKLQCSSFHLHLVILIKTLILCHCELVLPVTSNSFPHERRNGVIHN